MYTEKRKMTSTPGSSLLVVYVDELQQNDQEVQAAAVVVSTANANFMRSTPGLPVATKYDINALFPKQDFKDAGSSFRMINETERLSEVLSSNDEMTAIFVTGLVFAYVICLSLPVIFVTACSLYIKRMHKTPSSSSSLRNNTGSSNNNSNKRGHHQQPRLPDHLPIGQAGPPLIDSAAYVDSPIGMKVPKIVVEMMNDQPQQQQPLPPPVTFQDTAVTDSNKSSVDQKTPSSHLASNIGVQPHPSSTNHSGNSNTNTTIGSPNANRRAAMVRVSGPNRTLIPLRPLFDDWDQTNTKQQQNDLASIYQTIPPPPERFADKADDIKAAATPENFTVSPTYYIMEPYLSTV